MIGDDGSVRRSGEGMSEVVAANIRISLLSRF
jgi:hypothetical protein